MSPRPSSDVKLHMYMYTNYTTLRYELEFLLIVTYKRIFERFSAEEIAILFHESLLAIENEL